MNRDRANSVVKRQTQMKSKKLPKKLSQCAAVKGLCFIANSFQESNRFVYYTNKFANQNQNPSLLRFKDSDYTP